MTVYGILSWPLVDRLLQRFIAFETLELVISENSSRGFMAGGRIAGTLSPVVGGRNEAFWIATRFSVNSAWLLIEVWYGMGWLRVFENLAGQSLGA